MQPTTPKRLAQDVVKRIRRGGGDRAVDLVDQFAEVGEIPRRRRHIDGHHVGDRLAHAQRIEQREFLGVLLAAAGCTPP